MEALAPRSRLRLSVVQLDRIPHAWSEQDTLWIPAEPLADRDESPGSGTSREDMSTAALFLDHPDVYQEVLDLAVEAADEGLSDVLGFLKEQAVDIAVFPEYLLPVSCVAKLRAFSDGRVVVAGLQHVKGLEEAEELAVLDGRRSAEDLLYRNVAVLIENGTVRLITKKHRAKGEVLEAGTGPQVFELVLRGRAVRVGVSVCMDYLREEETVRQLNADILCVPAYSRTLDDFQPSAPRDHVRLLANCAEHGGSTVLCPDLRGPLVDRNGVKPLPAGHEGVVIVDWDGFSNRPVQLNTPDNRLHCRAEILERLPANQPSIDILTELAALPELSSLQTVWDSIAPRISTVPRTSPLREALEAYRRLVMQKATHMSVLSAIQRHLTARPGMRPGPVRLRQTQLIVERLSEVSGDNWGAATDVYRRLTTDLSARHAVPETPPGPPSSMASTDSEDETPVPDNVINLYADRPPDRGTIVSPPAAARTGHLLEVLEDLAARAGTLLAGVRSLATSGSKDEILLRSFALQDEVTGMVRLLSEIDGVMEQRSDFLWHNARAEVDVQLGLIRTGLFADLKSSNLKQTSLVKSALGLQRAFVEMRDIAP